MTATTTAATTTSRPELPDERRVAKGTVIFRQGDVGNEMFVIGEGSVRLTISTADGHEAEIGIFGAGEFFGELSLLSAAPRSANAIANEDSVLLVVSRDVFAMMVQDDLDIVARMMSAQGRRLSRANEPIQQLTQQLGRIRVAAHCLRHLLSGTSPMTCELESLARDVGLPAQAVAASAAHLAESGIGSLRDGRWTFTQEDVLRLVDSICLNSDAS